MNKKIWIGILVIIIAIAAAWGPVMSNVEQAKYRVVESHGAIEIRDYDPMIVAETEVKGSREESINQGFRTIADYIFGNNVSTEKVAMTAPVSQQASEKIAMTAPVVQQGVDSEKWKVHFVMPSAYTLENLPKPRNEVVKLREIPAKRFAVIRFSGIGNQKRLDQETKALNDFIEKHSLEANSSPIYAFFNPPWTLPLFRRNEVMIEIAK